MAIEVVTYLEKGDSLTFEEMDNNFTTLRDGVNAMNVTGVGNFKSMTMTPVHGDNTLVHGIGKKARFCNFFMSNGYPCDYSWRRDPDDQENKIIFNVPDETPAGELVDLEINVQAS